MRLLEWENKSIIHQASKSELCGLEKQTIQREDEPTYSVPPF